MTAAIALQMLPMNRVPFAWGVGPDAGFLQERVTERRDHSRRSEYLGRGYREMLAELAQIAHECAESNWDGEGALALTPEVIGAAREVLAALPDGLPQPELSPDPRGFVMLEWYGVGRRVLSISITPGRVLHFAAIRGSKRVCGSEPFLGGIPEMILSLAAEVSR